MKIGIVGMGVVGSATANGLSRGSEIVAYDKYKPFKTLEEVSQCPIIFICVPTPMRTSGQIDLSAVDDSIRSLQSDPKTIIVIHSTTVGGTTDFFAKKYPYYFAFNPEFLTEKNANQDFLNSSHIIIGTDSGFVFDEVAKVYRRAGFKCPIHYTDTKTAEMVKYVVNTFLATKVTFANEIYRICESLDIGYDYVMKLVKQDRRIGKTHLEVRGGFGGKCLPKDLNALIHLSREMGYRPRLLEEVWRSNCEFS